MRRTFLVVLVYYKEKAQLVIDHFVKNAQRYGINETLIVNNNYTMASDERYIKGDNTLSEFSGWEVARDMLIKNGLREEDIVIFANDTVLKHRLWTLVDDYAFTKGIKKLRAVTGIPAVCGEVLKASDSQYSINGLNINVWVSTYFFAVNGFFLLNSELHYKAELLSGFVKEYSVSSIVFDSSISESLSNHINSWLYPADGAHGWYKSKEVNQPEVFLNKAFAILNEKRLAARCLDMGGEVISVYENYFLGKYKSLSRRLFSKFS